MLTLCAQADTLSMRLFLLMGKTDDTKQWRRYCVVWTRAYARANRRRRAFEARLAQSPGGVISTEW